MVIRSWIWMGARITGFSRPAWSRAPMQNIAGITITKAT